MEADKPKRKKTTSPTARTLAALRKDGWTAQVVEKWIPQTMRRLDLFGGIDIVGIRPGETIGVQATSDLTGGNSGVRFRKMIAEPQLKLWLEAGNRLEIVAWKKQTRGLKRARWIATTRVLTLADFEDTQ